MIKQRFTDDQVIEIRRKAKRGKAFAALGREYGANANAIRKIVYGYSYKGVGGPITAPEKRRAFTNPNRKLNEEQVVEIRRLWWRGHVTLRELSEQFNVSSTTCYNVATKKIYKDIQDEQEPILLPSR